MINNKQIPITVRLTKENINISFNEEMLNGFAFNKNEYRKERIKITEEDKERINLLNVKYVKEQEERKLKDKIKNRYLAVDLNPEEISIVIVDKTTDNITNKIEDNQIVYKDCYNLNKLNSKLKLSSTDKKQIKQNNKRKYEIKEVRMLVIRMHKRLKY
jgi:hypothetical protein